MFYKSPALKEAGDFLIQIIIPEENQSTLTTAKFRI
jgi:hypothetical protein